MYIYIIVCRKTQVAPDFLVDHICDFIVVRYPYFAQLGGARSPADNSLGSTGSRNTTPNKTNKT